MPRLLKIRPGERVLVSTQARKLLTALIDQLAVCGRMVLPVNDSMLLVRRGCEGVDVTEHGRYHFAPLL